MSFNVGNDMSKFVVVSNVTMNFSFSDKILLADLRTSRKTGNPKLDPSGIPMTDENGVVIPERVFSHWEGRFVGNAFEAAKGLRNGDYIDILTGWIERSEKVSKSGKTFDNAYVVISDFRLSEFAVMPDDSESEPPTGSNASYPDNTEENVY